MSVLTQCIFGLLISFICCLVFYGIGYDVGYQNGYKDGLHDAKELLKKDDTEEEEC